MLEAEAAEPAAGPAWHAAAAAAAAGDPAAAAAVAAAAAGAAGEEHAPDPQANQQAARRYLQGPPLRSGGPPLLVMALSQGSTTVLYVPRVQLAKEWTGNRRAFTKGFLATLQKQWCAGEPPCIIKASGEEVRLMAGQGLVAPKASKAAWVLLPLLNRCWRSDERVAAEARRVLLQLERSGPGGLPALDAAVAAGAAAGQQTGQAAAREAAPMQHNRPEPGTPGGQRHGQLAGGEQQVQRQPGGEQQEQQEHLSGEVRLEQDDEQDGLRRILLGPRLWHNGPRTFVMQLAPRGGRPALYLLRAQVVQGYRQSGTAPNNLTARVERQHRAGEPPCSLLASGEEKRLLAAQGFSELLHSRLRWVLLPAVNRALQASSLPSSSWMQALAGLEASGIEGLRQLFLEGHEQAAAEAGAPGQRPQQEEQQACAQREATPRATSWRPACSKAAPARSSCR